MSPQKCFFVTNLHYRFYTMLALLSTIKGDFSPVLTLKYSNQLIDLNILRLAKNQVFKGGKNRNLYTTVNIKKCHLKCPKFAF